MNVPTTSSNLHEQIQQIYAVFDEYLPKHTDIYVCVSGGADSMLAMSLLHSYCKEREHSHSITLLHYDHSQRSTTKEKTVIEDTFHEYLITYGKYSGKKDTEKELRAARWRFFLQSMEHSSNPLLITGHNLSDRIETTFLNMARGASYKGIVNMRQYEVMSEFKGSYAVLRPLLGWSKTIIYEICRKLDVPYCEDPTNVDSMVSKRNKLRHEIIPELEKLGSSKTFSNSFSKLYSILEGYKGANLAFFDYLEPSIHWNVSSYLRFEIPTDMFALVDILDTLGIYKNISKKGLDDLLDFFTKSKSGRKKKDAYYFFKAHGACYACKAKEEFWKRYKTFCTCIDTLGTYSIGDFEVTIDSEQHLGGVLRYPKKGDKLKDELVTKYFSKRKIPFFWRKDIPVIESGGEIVYIYPFTKHVGHMY